MMARYRLAFYDTDGTRYAIPTYPWRTAPDGLATRRQLAARGLRPGRQPVCAQVMWGRYARPWVAYLFRLDLAKPKRTPTAAQLAALAKAAAARRRCPQCGCDAGYVIPRSLGTCVPCHDTPSTTATTGRTG
jgi:hypothetical protein